MTPSVAVSAAVRPRVPTTAARLVSRALRRAALRLGVSPEALESLAVRIVDDREMARLHEAQLPEETRGTLSHVALVEREWKRFQAVLPELRQAFPSLASRFDSLATMVMDGSMAKIIVWFDNGWGYSVRIVETLDLLAEFEEVSV